MAKRRNMTPMDMTRSMIAYANLFLNFWEEALSTIDYILNRVTIGVRKLIPFEYWTNYKPDLSCFRVEGCKAHVLIPKLLRDKLGDRS